MLLNPNWEYPRPTPQYAVIMLFFLLPKFKSFMPFKDSERAFHAFIASCLGYIACSWRPNQMHTSIVWQVQVYSELQCMYYLTTGFSKYIFSCKIKSACQGHFAVQGDDLLWFSGDISHFLWRGLREQHLSSRLFWTSLLGLWKDVSKSVIRNGKPVPPCPRCSNNMVQHVLFTLLLTYLTSLFTFPLDLKIFHWQPGTRQLV